MAKYPKNTILYTKDGRLIGNAIIQEEIRVGVYRIITDYGNSVVLLESQIDELFHPAYWLLKSEQSIAELTHKYYNPK